ncbi:phosphatidyl inositol kinase [Tulasnella sp. 332]|nr:phosphatidyl inositol kinase [Tulasnella sp. 332]
MPKRSDYVQIPQQDDAQDGEFEEGHGSEDDNQIGESPSAVHMRVPSSSSASRAAAGPSTSDNTSSRRPSKNAKPPGKIDLRSLDNAFKRWTQEITQKVRRKKKTMDAEARKEIVYSVFQRVLPSQSSVPQPTKTLDDGLPMTEKDFEALANSVRAAILNGVHPKMITKGSSGSYFARKKEDGRAPVVGVFKPKDEEAFSYGWIDRSNFKKGKPLPEKVGSLQTFMHGYQDTYDEATHRSGSVTVKRCSTALGVMCGRVGEAEEDEDGDDPHEAENDQPGTFHWTPAIQNEFREELEKLIILDYLMRNTDRGLDNFMIKFCEGNRERPVVSRAPAGSFGPQHPMMSQLGSTTNQPCLSTAMSATNVSPTPSIGLTQDAESSPQDRPHIHLAAIDNSLSFPHQHPKGWRNFTYGWLYLPVSLIGRPFSQKIRDHFLPLLSDPAWWSETTYRLRKLHKIDDGFNDRMFQRQMAVMKGQGWNIVQCLKQAEEGPLELTRRTKVLVWDEEVEVPVDATADEIIAIVAQAQVKAGAFSADVVGTPQTVNPNPMTPEAGFLSLPSSPEQQKPTPRRPGQLTSARRVRSYSIGGRLRSPDGTRFSFPFHSRRGSMSSGLDLSSRPVPFASKMRGDGALSGGATGVSVLAHLEKLDKVESGLNRVIGEGLSPQAANTSVLYEEEEDVGEAVVAAPVITADLFEPAATTSATALPATAPTEAEANGDIFTPAAAVPPPVPSGKPRTSLTFDLGSPPERPHRAGTSKPLPAVSSIATGPTLEQLLGSDDLESGRRHSRSVTDENEYSASSSRIGRRKSYDVSRPKDPLRKMKIVIAEFHGAVESIRGRLEKEAPGLAQGLGQPSVGIVCGSGLSGLGDALQDKVVIPYEELKGFGKSTVTNAAGSLNPKIPTGTIVVIHDHLALPDLTGHLNPLLGPVLAPPFETRFVPLSKAYSFELRKVAFRAAHELQFPREYLAEGTYAWVSGPTYETAAEGRFLRAAGADVVGMSTVPEVLAAVQARVEVLVLSLVSNPVIIPDSYPSAREAIDDEVARRPPKQVVEEEVSHADVLEVGKQRGEDMKRLVEKIVEML